MKKRALTSLCSAFFLLFISFAPAAFCQEQAATLQEGIEQYREGNYEEAIEALQKVREKEPTSSVAAFFLGLAYKQTMEYSIAISHLQEAVTLTPRIKEALVEIIDTLYQLDRIHEAKKWIRVAEEERIYPARVLFLKGLILSKENKNMEAIEAFEKAKKLDPTIDQAAEFQIAMSYMKERKLDKAKERLQIVVTRDPLSDLATFARQYQDLVEKRMYLERPLRLTVSIFGGYDTNIVSKPTNDIIAGDITDEKGRVLQTSVRVDYVPTIDGPWLFNASYSIASNVNQKHTHSHDSLAQTFSVSPGYNFGRFAVNFLANYTNVLLRTDPDTSPDPDSNPGYKRYIDDFTYGPSIKFLVTQNNILEIFAGYDKKEYYNQKKTSARTDRFWENNRDAEGPKTYISWIWLFKENSFLNLRYDYTREHADGMYWDNKGHRFTANFSMPLLSEETAKRTGPVTLQVTGGYFRQIFNYEQPYQDVDGSTKSTKRKDKTYTGSVGLAWEFYKNTSFIAQYTNTECDANIPANDYTRNLYTAGFEFRF